MSAGATDEGEGRGEDRVEDRGEDRGRGRGEDRGRGRGEDRGRGRAGRRAFRAGRWKPVVARVRAESKSDRLSLLAAGIAFYGLMSFVPAMVAGVSVYGLVADPADIDRQVQSALGSAPEEVRAMISAQLTSIAGAGSGETVVALIGGLVLALWSASSGMGKLIDALNVAYDETETRGFVRRRLTSLGLTVGALGFVLFAVTVIAVLPPLIGEWGLGSIGRVGAEIARFGLLGLAMVVGLSVLYRTAPNHGSRSRWASSGATVATVIWLIASVLFSVYTANFASYNETYGTLGAAVVIMLWLMIGAAAVLLGAEVNRALELTDDDGDSRLTHHRRLTDGQRGLTRGED